MMRVSLKGIAVLIVVGLGPIVFPGGCRREADDFVTLMNRGKAYLENRDSKNAIDAFERAVQLRAESAAAHRNLARAHRLARQPEKALQALKKAERLEASSPANSYLLGLTLASLSWSEEAIRHMEEAVRLDPHLATLRFQLAILYESIGDEERGIEQLHETLRLDPLHASANFKLATYARRVQDAERFERHHTEFLRLRQLFGDETRTPEMLETCIYTFPEPPPLKDAHDRVAWPKAIDVQWVDVTDQIFPSGEEWNVSCAAVLEIDASGRLTVFVAGTNGEAGLLTMTTDGVFEHRSLDVSLPQEPVRECRVGDFHDDVPPGETYDANVHAFNDVVLIAGAEVRLLKQTARREFRDVTEEAGLSGVRARTVSWVDCDHDGDLDLLVGDETDLHLWQNNGNGTFTEVASQVGIESEGPMVDLAAVDLDTNGAIDLIAARDTKPTHVFVNQRAGRFARMTEPPGPWPAARFVLADDLSNDGHPDVVLIADDGATILYGQSAQRDHIDLGRVAVSSAVLLDYDNDGWLDLLVGGEVSAALAEDEEKENGQGVLRLFRNGGPGRWKDVSEAVGLSSISLPGVAQVIPGDFDVDRDTDLLLITVDNRLRWLRNEGGHKHGLLRIRLSTLKSNPTGLGVRLELRAGDDVATRTVSHLPIEIGLAGRTRLDSVQMLWSNGIVDNLIDVTVPTDVLTIVERNIAAGSCPFLYAWDGERFRFVTDILGNSPVGLPISREEMLPADPDEIVYIGKKNVFPPRDGHYTLVITDEFREVLYLDYAALIAVDHTPHVEVHPTDKLMPSPFPPSEVWAMTNRSTLLRAAGDDGIDRTEAVREIDGVFTPPGPLLPPPYRGMCHPLTLVLEFDELDAAKPLVLALTGWLQYGDASVNIAMSQNPDLTMISPTLEAETASGEWTPVDVVVGMPAGKTKTVLIDLDGRLPEGPKRLRLTTTFQTRWDRIALFERVPLPEDAIHECNVDQAELRWRGFSELIARAPGHPTTPDFDVVFDRPHWRTVLEGWCTRYGDVTELVSARNDQLAILNSGDALYLRYRADRFPPVPAGKTRTFFFYSVGWDKDGDHNVETGRSVEPLPVEAPIPIAADGAALDENHWRVRYNTRWVPFDLYGKP